MIWLIALYSEQELKTNIKIVFIYSFVSTNDTVAMFWFIIHITEYELKSYIAVSVTASHFKTIHLRNKWTSREVKIKYTGAIRGIA